MFAKHQAHSDREANDKNIKLAARIKAAFHDHKNEANCGLDEFSETELAAFAQGAQLFVWDG